MSQSLVNQFVDRRKAGEKLATALKESIFQAKPPDIYFDDLEGGKNPFKLWKINMRPLMDDEPVDWWFSSTAIPIISATIGPLANVCSIGSLVTFWRVDLAGAGVDLSTQLQGTLIRDPQWCYYINLFSLILGFVGNFFLLMNFGNRIKYIIALPLTIVLWLLASGFLIADLAAMNIHQKPAIPDVIWSGGFWYALAAAVLYFILMVILTVNLIGYVRGHYQHFELTHDQRTLIVQTSLYFIWLGGGAAVYSKIEGWHFTDGLYFASVTTLTIGYGDLYPTTTLGRAILIPWSFGNLINLGLVVFAIYKSVSDLGQKNVVQKHYEHARERIIGRTVTNSMELERKEIEQELLRERDHAKHAARSSARSGGSLNTRKTIYQLLKKQSTAASSQAESLNSIPLSRAPSFGSTERSGWPLTRVNSFTSVARKKNRILLLRDEKERFEAMRKIQSKQQDWTDWLRLVVSMTIFAVFWLVGAAGFWVLEADTLELTYFEAVYFCWVTLITLGYGDYAPKSWGGRCLYVIFVQFAVPSITILVNDLSTTIIAKFVSISNSLSTSIIRGKEDLKEIAHRFAWLLDWLKNCLLRHKEKKEKAPIINGVAPNGSGPNGFPRVDSMIEREKKGDAFASGLARPDTLDLVKQHEDDIHGKVPDAAALARQLALAIRRAARDMTAEETKKYTFEEWVEFTRLIRFTAAGGAREALREEEDEGLVDWDWLAENSPMMAESSEAEFVLERLTESLVRYLKRNPPHDTFIETVKSQGEAALRLRTTSHHEDEDESYISPLSSPIQNSRPNMIGKPTIGSIGAQSLHPVEEEDHGHH